MTFQQHQDEEEEQDEQRYGINFCE